MMPQHLLHSVWFPKIEKLQNVICFPLLALQILFWLKELTLVIVDKLYSKVAILQYTMTLKWKTRVDFKISVNAYKKHLFTCNISWKFARIIWGRAWQLILEITTFELLNKLKEKSAGRSLWMNYKYKHFAASMLIFFCLMILLEKTLFKVELDNNFNSANSIKMNKTKTKSMIKQKHIWTTKWHVSIFLKPTRVMETRNSLSLLHQQTL